MHHSQLVLTDIWIMSDDKFELIITGLINVFFLFCLWDGAD